MKLSSYILIRHSFLVFAVLFAFSKAYTQNGFNDPHFYTGSGSSSVTGVQKLLVLQDDRILIAGSFSTFNDTVCHRLTCLKANGGIDTNFHAGNGVASYIYAMQEQPDGKIILAGDFTSYNDTAYASVVRIFPNGAIDNTFNPGTGPDHAIQNCKLQPDGKLLLAGQFTTFNGTMASGVVRLNADGSIDNTFITGTGVDAGTGLGQIILEPSGKIVLTGNAFSYNGTPVNRIFRVNSDGSLDPTFVIDLSSNQPISTILRQSDGDYIVMGSFNEFNGQPITHIAFLTPDGQLNTAFTSSGFSDATMLRGYVQPDDKIIIHGSFNTYNGVVNNGILRLNPDGTVDPEFSFTYGANNWVQAVGKQSQPGLIVGGMFTTFENEQKNHITRILNCSPVTQDVYETACSTYSWLASGLTYNVSGTYSAHLTTVDGCDSVVTLNLTILPPAPLTVNTYTLPSAPDECVGTLAVTANGNADFTAAIDGGAVFTHSGHQLVGDLCVGIHSLLTTDACGDSLTTTFIIAVDSNYIFNNPFIDSIAVDSLGMVTENCTIYYNGIDTAYIDSVFSTANVVTVIWNIVDSSGSTSDTSTYVLNNGNGVYYLQLSVFCPNKALGEYFTVGQAIYFENGSIFTAGIDDHQELQPFSLFPNPTSGSVMIASDSPFASLQVVDMQGKLILERGIHQNESVSLDQQQPGVYFFRLTSEKGSFVQRIIKN